MEEEEKTKDRRENWGRGETDKETEAEFFTESLFNHQQPITVEISLGEGLQEQGSALLKETPP